MLTFWQGRAKQAQEHPKPRFGNLDEWLHEALLKACWRDMRHEAASGVDHGSAQDYEANLDAHIHDVVERLKRKRYRAKHVRRTDMPKGNGQRRP